jgi:hypothetical protein
MRRVLEAVQGGRVPARTIGDLLDTPYLYVDVTANGSAQPDGEDRGELPSLADFQGLAIRLQAHAAAREYLKERGIDPQVAERCMVGYGSWGRSARKAFWFPCLDVRRRQVLAYKCILWPRDDGEEYRFNSARPAGLFPWVPRATWRGRPVLITEGEWDCLAVRSALSVRLDAYCSTAGQHVDWPALWRGQFTERRVFVCFDADAWEHTQALADEIGGTALDVRPVADRDKFDLNDLLRRHGGAAVLRDLIDKCESNTRSRF